MLVQSSTDVNKMKFLKCWHFVVVLNLLFFVYASMSVHQVHAESMETRRGCWMPCNYGRLWAQILWCSITVREKELIHQPKGDRQTCTSAPRMALWLRLAGVIRIPLSDSLHIQLGKLQHGFLSCRLFTWWSINSFAWFRHSRKDVFDPDKRLRNENSITEK